MINVVGTGRAVAQPDVVRVRLSASVVRATLAAALADSEDATSRLRAALAAQGVALVDASTVGLAVTAEQVWTEQQGSRITGFRSEHELAVVLRDLPSAGRILGEVLVAGGDDVRLGGVEFVVEDDEPLRIRAREAAWRDAVSRGTQLATLAGHRLGAVTAIDEQTGYQPGPVPMLRMAAMAAPEMGVSPGTVGVEVSLAVRWEIA